MSSWRVAAFAAVWAIVAGTALFAPGCYGDNCVGSIEFYGSQPGQGVMLDETSWASNAVDENWLWFPRQRLYFFDIPKLGGRTPQAVVPYISAAPSPIKTANDFTIGGGNLALISGVGPNRVAVKNDTCSDYYLRLWVQTTAIPPSDDAGPDAAPDAALDAASDAGPDAAPDAAP